MRAHTLVCDIARGVMRCARRLFMWRKTVLCNTRHLDHYNWITNGAREMLDELHWAEAIDFTQSGTSRSVPQHYGCP